VRLTTHLHLVPRLKNEWNYISTPQYAFMAWCLFKKKAEEQLYLLAFTQRMNPTKHQKEEAQDLKKNCHSNIE
jgi:hypothetical protein